MTAHRTLRIKLRQFAIHAGVLLAILAVAGFLTAASGIIPIKASSGHWPMTEWFLQFSKKRSVSFHSVSIPVPPLEDPSLVLKGAGHYDLGCRPCHGSPALHHPRVASSMTPHPPYLPPRIAEWEPEELFYIVKHGLKFTGMPAWPSQNRDDEVWAMVAFLLEMQQLDEEAYQRLVGGESPAAEDAPLQGLAQSEIVATVTENCARCHGAAGEGRGSRGAFPKLAGQPSKYLEQAIRAYADGRRHSGIMEPIAAGLDSDEIAQIAEYYSQLASVRSESNAQASAERVQLGKSIADEGIPDQKVAACASCHGPGQDVRNPHHPFLAGQFADYLVLQLELFQDRHRGGSDYAHLMHPIADRLAAEQMQAVAAYYESLGPTMTGRAEQSTSEP